MTNLSKTIRGDLAQKLLRRAFHARVQAHIEATAAFVLCAYEEGMGEKGLALANSLPAGWLPMERGFRAQIAGEVAYLSFAGGIKSWCLPVEFKLAGGLWGDPPQRRFPHDRCGGVLATFDGGSSIANRYQEVDNARSALIAEISAAQSQIRIALNKVSTIKKLIEVWPEVEEFAKPYLVKGDRELLLPAIPRANLNAMLGLPPGESEAA